MKLKKYLKKKLKILYIQINTKDNEEEEIKLIKCLYSNLFEGSTIQKSYDEIKAQIKYKDMVQLKSINKKKKEIILSNLNNGKIELN